MDLVARAWQAMRDEGFAPELSPEVSAQLSLLTIQEPAQTGEEKGGEVRDLRTLLWSSIDNVESRDLDQVEWAARLSGGDIRLLVGIADVDCRVAHWSPLDAYAVRSTTSVYTGVVTFPMLPEALSNNLTSLNVGEDRLAIIVELIVDAVGKVRDGKVYRAWLRNHARLVYEEVGPWLEGTKPLPPTVAAVPDLETQLRLQDEAAIRLAARRRREGALELQTMEAQPVLTAEGRVELKVPLRNRAHLLIENLMVTANSVIAGFLAQWGIPAIQRVVRRPERWARIVALAQSLGDDTLPQEPDASALSAFLSRRREAEPIRFPDLSLAVVKLLGPGEYVLVRPKDVSPGHFGLAAPTYTHSTAPNRRYADLIAQRLVKATLAGKWLPYDVGDLELLAHHCTEREDAARRVERLMRKVAAAVMLRDQIGKVFEAVVTGVSSRKGTFVRVLSPPIEGRVVAGQEGLDVGDIVTVRLLAAEPVRGWIDFTRVFLRGGA